MDDKGVIKSTDYGVVSGKPARQIPIGTRSVTGKFAVNGTAYESSLERDFLTICAFDCKVISVVGQPVRIPFINSVGKQRKYTPDFLVRFDDRWLKDGTLRNQLCEIKPQEALQSAQPDLLERLEAGKRFAEENSWDFKIFTEAELRTPYLTNATFLLPYRNEPWDTDKANLLLAQLRELDEIDIKTFMDSLFRDKWMQAAHLPTLWALMATFHIQTDLTLPLTPKSLIWHY